MESIVTMGMKPDRDRQRGRSFEENLPDEADRSGYAAGRNASVPTASGAASSALRENDLPEYLRSGRTVSGGGSAAAAQGKDSLKDAGQAGQTGQAGRDGHPQDRKMQLREEHQRLEEEEKRALRVRRKQYLLIAEYVVATVLVCYILLRLTDNAGRILVFLGNVAQTVGRLLMPLFWGFILAYILSPVVAYFEGRLRHVSYFRKSRRGRRAPAVAITCVLTLVAFSVLCSVVVSAVTHSLKVASIEDLITVAQSFTGTLGSFQQTIMSRLGALNISSTEVTNALKEIGQRIASFTGGVSKSMTSAIGQVGGFLTGTLFAIIFAIYFLLDGKGLMRYWNRVLYAVGGKKVRRNFHVLVMDADAVFSGYVRGQLIDAFIMAVLVSTALSVVGVKYAVIIGVLSGIGNLIPYLGPVVAYGSTILVCLLSGDLRRLLVALVVLFIIQTVDGNVINPRLLSSSIDVHPMLVIAALIIGGAAGGLVGMLFAVPVAAFLKIQFDKVIAALLHARMPADGKKAKAKTKAKTAAKAESEVKTEAKAKTEAGARAGADSEARAKADAEGKTKTKAKAKTKAKTKTGNEAGEKRRGNRI